MYIIVTTPHATREVSLLGNDIAAAFERAKALALEALASLPSARLEDTEEGYDVIVTEYIRENGSVVESDRILCTVSIEEAFSPSETHFLGQLV